MILLFWFCDYIFMCFVFLVIKKCWFKNCNVFLLIVYMFNMMIMGFWYGVIWYYIFYGFLYGLVLVVNDWWLWYKCKYFKIKINVFIKGVVIFIIFNFVVFILLIFCGFLDKFWFYLFGM